MRGRCTSERCSRSNGAPTRATASSLLRWIGRLHRQAGDVDAALDAFDAALTIAELADDDAEIGKAFHEQADIHRRLAVSIAPRRSTSRRASPGTRHRGDAPGRDVGRSASSVIAMVRGDHEKALRHQRASLAEYRALGVPKEVLELVAAAWAYCAWSSSAGKIRLAAFDEAEQIAEALGDLPERVGF